MQSDAYVDALRSATVPQNPYWFQYKMSDPAALEVVAASLRDFLGIAFEPEDITLTSAAIAALAVTFKVLCQPGDEVIITQPPHFLYEPLIMAAGASAVRVPVTPETFDLDVDAIERAITLAKQLAFFDCGWATTQSRFFARVKATYRTRSSSAA